MGRVAGGAGASGVDSAAGQLGGLGAGVAGSSGGRGAAAPRARKGPSVPSRLRTAFAAQVPPGPLCPVSESAQLWYVAAWLLREGLVSVLRVGADWRLGHRAGFENTPDGDKLRRRALEKMRRTVKSITENLELSCAATGDAAEARRAARLLLARHVGLQPEAFVLADGGTDWASLEEALRDSGALQASDEDFARLEVLPPGTRSLPLPQF